jgi:hypothetical protein
MELIPAYVDVLVRRWETLTRTAAMLEATAETFTEMEAKRRTLRAGT